jgi:predicted xylose isomerase-like sugar epimerase
MGRPKPSREQLLKAVEAIMTTTTVKDAAEKVGMTVVTLHRWKRTPEFQEALIEVRTTMLQNAVNQLLVAQTEAIYVLRELQTDKHSDFVRLKAATTLMQTFSDVMAYSQLDTRMANLESAISEINTGGHQNGNIKI